MPCNGVGNQIVQSGETDVVDFDFFASPKEQIQHLEKTLGYTFCNNSVDFNVFLNDSTVALFSVEVECENGIQLPCEPTPYECHLKLTADSKCYYNSRPVQLSWLDSLAFDAASIEWGGVVLEWDRKVKPAFFLEAVNNIRKGYLEVCEQYAQRYFNSPMCELNQEQIDALMFKNYFVIDLVVCSEDMEPVLYEVTEDDYPGVIHPKARKLMNEEFFWDVTEESSPFGNDDGADASYTFEEWRPTHKTTSALQCFRNIVEEWEVSAFDWTELNELKLANEFNNGVGFDHVLTTDNLLIAVGFAQFVMEGEVDDELHALMRNALQRQLLPVCLDPWEEHKNGRQYNLSRMLRVVNLMNR